MADHAIAALQATSPALEQFVFGYGSLTRGFRGRPARLEGHRRVWGVAMDNRVTVPGYKLYRRRADGSRPAVYVAFLDIMPDVGAGAATGGFLFAADDVVLRALDAREHNYDRVDVTAAVPDATGTVWAYRGSAAGRERLRLGLLGASVVVDLNYVTAVRASFAALGIDDDLGAGSLPVMDLERVELPGRAARPS